LKKRGVHVVLSNSSAPAVYELYEHAFETVPIRARRDINCRADARGEILELLMR